MRFILAVLLTACGWLAHGQEHEAACRARLKQLGGAVAAFRLLHDKAPAKLSELYRDGLAENLSDFVCPAAGTSITLASEIDAKSAYTLEALPETKDLLVREKTPHHKKDEVLALFADGSIKLIKVPDSNTGTQSTAGTGTISGGTGTAASGNSGSSPTLPAADPPEFTRAHELYLQGKYTDALKLFDAAVQKAPGHRQASFERAVVRLWLNQVREALDDWKALAAANPNDFESRTLRAGLELVAGDPRLALAEAEALTKLAPNNAMSWVVHAQAALWNNKIPEAEKSLTQALKLDPNTMQSLHNQACQFLSAGVPLLAQLQFSTVLAIDSKQAGAYHGLGFACAKLGQKEAAIQSLKKYLEFDQTSPYAQSAKQELERLSR